MEKTYDTNKIHIVLGVIVLPIGIYALVDSFFISDPFDYAVSFIAGFMITAFGIILLLSGIKKVD